jgi:hypothetical protein
VDGDAGVEEEAMVELVLKATSEGNALGEPLAEMLLNCAVKETTLAPADDPPADDGIIKLLLSSVPEALWLLISIIEDDKPSEMPLEILFDKMLEEISCELIAGSDETMLEPAVEPLARDEMTRLLALSELDDEESAVGPDATMKISPLDAVI